MKNGEGNEIEVSSMVVENETHNIIEELTKGGKWKRKKKEKNVSSVLLDYCRIRLTQEGN